MTVLVDANILLDVLQDRNPYVKASSIIWKLCEVKQIKGYISVLTFANLIYILRKDLSPTLVEEVFSMLSLIFEFADLSSSDLANAAAMQWSDYEDAVQSVLAEKIHADFIITRNCKDFAQSPVFALTPDEYIMRMH